MSGRTINWNSVIPAFAWGAIWVAGGLLLGIKTVVLTLDLSVFVQAIASDLTLIFLSVFLSIDVIIDVGMLKYDDFLSSSKRHFFSVYMFLTLIVICSLFIHDSAVEFSERSKVTSIIVCFCCFLLWFMRSTTYIKLHDRPTYEKLPTAPASTS